MDVVKVREQEAKLRAQFSPDEALEVALQGLLGAKSVTPVGHAFLTQFTAKNWPHELTEAEKYFLASLMEQMWQEIQHGR